MQILFIVAPLPSPPPDCRARFYGAWWWYSPSLAGGVAARHILAFGLDLIGTVHHVVFHLLVIFIIRL